MIDSFKNNLAKIEVCVFLFARRLGKLCMETCGHVGASRRDALAEETSVMEFFYLNKNSLV